MFHTINDAKRCAFWRLLLHPHESGLVPIIVPRSLLGDDDWVDLTISVANTARPHGDWRDLGFATTGFQWKPVEGS